jgi:hypothetical protein
MPLVHCRKPNNICKNTKHYVNQVIVPIKTSLKICRRICLTLYRWELVQIWFDVYINNFVYYSELMNDQIHLRTINNNIIGTVLEHVGKFFGHVNSVRRHFSLMCALFEARATKERVFHLRKCAEYIFAHQVCTIIFETNIISDLSCTLRE